MKARMRFGLAALGTGFVLVLLFTTLRSTATPLGLSDGDRASAQRTCHAAVRARVPDARFPHDASVAARDDGRLALSGSVDAGGASQAVRRNYACLLRGSGAGTYTPDSVTVWQSH